MTNDSGVTLRTCRRPDHGFTLIEVMLAMSLGALLIVSMGSVIVSALAANDEARQRNELAADARFAMQRIVSSAYNAGLLLIPKAENPATGRRESLREPGVLAVTISPLLDRDLDGFVDADNDRDGRVDEDWPADISNDGEPGLIGLDDNNNGFTDSSFAGSGDDDETGFLASEDPVNGTDDDGDGAIDEDPSADMNGDGAPGVAGIDDDDDSLVDEGDPADDDEDGLNDEDWLDAIAYYLSGSKLIERYPNLNPSDGADFTERTITDSVSLFRVERQPRVAGRTEAVSVILELTRQDNVVRIEQQLRIGGPP